MPTSTHTPGSGLNPSQKDSDEKFNDIAQNSPEYPDVEKGLSDLENFSRENAADVDKSIAEKEQEPSSGIINNFTGEKNKTKGKFWTRRKTALLGGGGGILGLLIFFISGFLPIGGLLINLGEQATANLDTRETILTSRMYRVLDAKLTGSVTSGSCSTVKIACRFSKPSNAFLSRLSDYGITAINADGNVVEKTTLGFPNERPEKYRFTQSTGEVVEVDAKNFTKELRSNAEFRSKFTKAFNMRYLGYTTNAIKNLFYKKNGVDRSGTTTKSIDPDTPGSSVKAIANGVDGNNPVKKAGADADIDTKNNAAKRAISEGVEKETKKTARRIARTGGDPLLAAGAIGCMAINAVPFVTNIVRLYQMQQVIALAANIILTPSSMTKAGDMTPELMASIGTLLTASSILPDGSRTKSAMDSFGMKSILYGDSRSSNTSYQKFIPGAAVNAATGGFNAFATNEATKSTCEVINSPAAAVAVGGIEIAVSTTGVGAIAVGILKLAGIVAGATILSEQALKYLSDSGVISQVVGAIVGAIPEDVIAAALANQDVENASEEDLGNALAAGIRFFYSSSTLSTGGVPMTTTQVAAFDTARNETIAQYAEQDRVERSPFDISSPYTFLGSIASNYYTTAYSVNNVSQTILGTLGYIAKAPLNVFSPNTFAVSSNYADQCTHAEESGVDSSVGVGPFSELCAGFPVEYLNSTTSEVFNSVSGMINEDSGSINEDSDLGLANADCSEGSLLNAKGCIIDPSQDDAEDRAVRQLYNFDLEINNMLDGEDSEVEQLVSTERPEGAIDADRGWTFAPGVDYSQYSCDPRTTEYGVSTLSYRPAAGATVRLCELSGLDWYGGAVSNGGNLLSSAIATNAIDMFEAARAEGVNIQLNDGFRITFHDNYVSQHTTGLSMDIGVRGENTICRAGASSQYGWGSPENAEAQCARIGGAQYTAYKWLQEHAAEYGFYNYTVEPWHWSTSGL